MEFQLKQTHSQPYMGYEAKRQNTPSAVFKHALPAKKTQAEEGKMEIGIINNEVNQFESTTKLSSSVVLDDHSYCWLKDIPKRLACVIQRNLTEVLVNEINELILENKLKERLCAMQIVTGHFFKWHKAETNAKMDFYTGIQTIEMFNDIFILIKHICQILSIGQHRQNIQ